MPKVEVEIEWNKPDEQQWLNADNINHALQLYCKNTKFKVKTLDNREEPEQQNENKEKYCNECGKYNGETVLQKPSRHTLIQCFEELKFGRPCKSQEFLENVISELKKNEDADNPFGKPENVKG